jgi:hypothetical protein
LFTNKDDDWLWYKHGYKLNGTLTPELGLLSDLTEFGVGLSQISGTIPPELFGNWTQIEALNFGTMKLSGTIPREVGQMTALSQLFMDHNAFTGSVPSEVGNLTELNQLKINNNDLSGTIPKELSTLRRINILMLSRNYLTGTLPSEIGFLSTLEQLDVSYNQLSGRVPSSFCGLLPGKERGDSSLVKNKLTIELPFPCKLSDALPLVTGDGSHDDDNYCAMQPNAPARVAKSVPYAQRLLESLEGREIDCVCLALLQFNGVLDAVECNTVAAGTKAAANAEAKAAVER